MPIQFTAGRFRYRKDDGTSASGYRLYTYSAGTTTFRATYTDATLNTANTYTTDGSGNKYITLSARGEAAVWLDTGAYLFVVTDASGVTQQSTDGVQDSGAAAVDDLRNDLADTASATLGPALVGFKPSLDYADATVGNAIRMGGVTPSMFTSVGAVDPTGVTDSTTAIQAWASSALPKRGEPGTFKVSGTITFNPDSPVVDCCGMVLDASDGGTWTGATVVSMGGAITAIAGVSGALSANAQTIPFSAAHTLVTGDVAILYNDDDYSWYPSAMRPSDALLQRAEYREGEFFRVLSVTDSTHVVTEEPLWSAYSSGSLTVYKMDKADVTVRNLTVIGPSAAAVVAIKPSLCTKLRLENVHAPDSNYLGIYLDRCFDVEMRGCTAVAGVSAISDSYGLLIGNSQRVRVFGGSFMAVRGGLDVGGDDLSGAVPSRDVRVIGAMISNDPSNTSPACDLHANLQGFTVENSTIRGGASWAGMDVSYINCDISSPAAPAGALVVGGSDWLGGKAEIRGGSLTTTTAASTSAVVRTVVNRYAKDDTTVMFDCGDIVAGANTSLVLTEMVSTATKKANVVVTRASFRTQPASLAQIARMQGTGSGGDGDRVIVDNIDNAPSGCNLYVATAGFGSTIKAKLMQQTATGTVTTGTSVSVTSINPVTWRYPYGSKVPIARGYGINTIELGTKRLVAVARVSNASTGVVELGTADRTNFPSATAIAGYLTVGVNEL